MYNFLTPVLVLIVWSLIIWCVLYARRIPAMKAAKIAPDSARSPDGDWTSKLPNRAQYAAHNYNHLMEQPTIFYALMFYIQRSDLSDGWFAHLAWVYVILRIVHSLVQISVNKVIVRFTIFSLASLILIVMAVLAVLKTF